MKILIPVLGAAMLAGTAWGQVSAVPHITVQGDKGKPVELREMQVKATVRGTFARVETTLRFHNPNNRVLEGELVFPLPDGGAVCGYALDVNGALVDGVAVPKEKARVAFETEVRRGVDPGLVEAVRGNVYRTRVYPLPARGDRTVKVSYAAPLATDDAGGAALSLPMPREKLARRRVEIDVVREGEAGPEVSGLGDRRFERAESRWHVECEEEDVAPGDDVLVAMPLLPELDCAVEKTPDGRYFFAVTATAAALGCGEPETSGAPWSGVCTVLWDASASRAAADHEKEYALLEALKGATGFRLVAFRDAPEEPREFADAAALVKELKKIEYDGGTALAPLSAVLPKGKGALALLFTDGLDTLAGGDERDALELPGATPVVASAEADRQALRRACEGRLVDLTVLADADAAARAVLSPARTVAKASGRGLKKVTGVGREVRGRVTVLGEMTGASSELTVRAGANKLKVPLKKADAREGTTLAAAWAAARVEELSGQSEAHAAELEELGKAFGVVSPATSLLVLDTLDQWVRHGVEPPASLPEMREQWRKKMDEKAANETSAVSRHVDQLADAWKKHVEWWENPEPFSPATTGSQHPVYRQDNDTGFVAVHTLSARGNGRLARRASVEEDAFVPLSAGMPAPEAAYEAMPDMVMEENFAGTQPAIVMRGLATAGESAAREPAAAPEAPSNGPTVELKAWKPNAPYLESLGRCRTPHTRRQAYFEARKEWGKSPAFFLDCANHFLANDDIPFARQVLSNLAELRLDDPELLRVYAARLLQLEDFDGAVLQYRRLAVLRPEDPHSFRDLARALVRRAEARAAAGDMAGAAGDAREALALYRKVAMKPWARHGTVLAVFALEEHNALLAWADAQSWPDGVEPPADAEPLPEAFRRHLDVDVRIVMSWDADSTDMDLHVVEPSGEEAYYGHRNTLAGGFLSPDIVDGFGPEEYLLRRAPAGTYAVRAKYFASHQQRLVGPATLFVDVYTDWGRPAQKRQTMTLRLERAKDIEDIGTVRFEGSSTPVPEPEPKDE